jgi:tetratricopeptide (TPR) repeat protein
VNKNARRLAIQILLGGLWVVAPLARAQESDGDAAGADAEPSCEELESRIALAGSDGGAAAFRELTRLVKRMGERAVPALIEARRDPSPVTRGWAASALDALDKRTPGDAVQTTDNQVLAGVLLAYGHVRDLDALPVVLSFVGSERAPVRAAARESTLAYGDLASKRLRAAYAALMTEDFAPDALAADMAQKLFGASDRLRLEEVHGLLDRGLAARRAGQLTEAVSSLDAALAREPMLDRRAEAAPAYLEYAISRELSDRDAAVAYLRKALRVDPSGPTSSRVRSELAYLEGADLAERGISEPEAFERALALDPDNTQARAALDRLRADAETRRASGRRLAAACGVAFSALGALIVLGVLRRRRR